MPPSSELKRCQKERGAASRPVVALSLAMIFAGDCFLSTVKPLPAQAGHLLRRALGKQSSNSSQEQQSESTSGTTTTETNLSTPAYTSTTVVAPQTTTASDGSVTTVTMIGEDGKHHRRKGKLRKHSLRDTTVDTTGEEPLKMKTYETDAKKQASASSETAKPATDSTAPTPSHLQEPVTASGSSSKAEKAIPDSPSAKDELTGDAAHLVSKHTELGDGYFNNRDYTNALIEYETVLKTDKDNFKAHFMLGKVLMGLSDFEEALKEFDQVIAIRSSSGDGHFMKAEALRMLGKYSSAKDEYEQSL